MVPNAKAASIAELDQQIAGVNRDIEKIESMRESDQTKFEVKDKDLGMGVSSLKGAITGMKSGKILIALGKRMRRTLAMTDMMDMKANHYKLRRFLPGGQRRRPRLR